jgi:hypothetical protein
MRHLQEANLLLPVRPLDGPSPHDVVWRPASGARILQVLKNPAAYVYGRRRRTPLGRRSGSAGCATEAVAIQDWPVCLKDAFPGYIDWEEFMANQRGLADNLNRYDMNRHGLPRRGNALLQGVAVCGRRMGLRYSGPHGNYPVYVCQADQHQYGGPRCLEVRALGIDAAVERLLLEALTPDRLALAIAALGELENEARALERQWSLKRERARYEAERARRQYDAVEPENRLVARSLEPVWEDKLRQVEQIDAEYESSRRQQPVSLAAAERGQILALGEDLPKLWGAASPVERKHILRLVIKDVILDQRVASGQVWMRIVWQTGAVSEHKVRRTNYADIGTLEARVRDLAAAQRIDRDIAAALTAEGLLSAHGRLFSGGEIHILRKRWQIPTVKINDTAPNPPRWPDGTFSVQGAAAVLSVSTQTVFKWLRKGDHQAANWPKGCLGRLCCPPRRSSSCEHWHDE